MKLLFIVNPVSGGVDKEPFLIQAKTLCEKYGISYHLFKTKDKNDKQELKKKLAEVKPDRVVSVGGDGTTLFTAISLLETDYPMGIIPLGSANGMAKELFVNPEPVEAFKDIIMSSRVEGLDILKVNEKHYCLHIGDVGVNAQIIEGYEKDANRGMLTYAKYFIEALNKPQPFPVKVKANGKTYDKQVFMVGICNARKYGTGVPLNLKGNPMDGKFEIVLITKVDASSLIKAGLSSFDENFLDEESTTVISTREAVIEFDKARPLQLDGEIAGDFKTVRVELIKKAIQFITHGDNEYLD